MASLSPKLRPSALSGSLAWGPSLWFSSQAPKGPPWAGSWPVVQCLRPLMGHLLLVSLQCWLWRQKYQQYRLASRAAWLSSTGISLQSPPSHPLSPSLRSQQQPLPWDCSTVRKCQLLATAPSRRPAFLPSICMAVARAV